MMPDDGEINAMAECVTDYLSFSVENIILTRTVMCFPNNKTWITIHPLSSAYLRLGRRCNRSRRVTFSSSSWGIPRRFKGRWDK